MQLNINRRRTLNAIRSPRVCDLQSIELIGQPQTFDPVLIDQLANLILDSGNLATPLLVRRRDNLKYTLVAGTLEYQAALRAREIEPSFKDVLAYILDSETEPNMLQQRQISSHLGPIHAPESHTPKTTASGWQVAQPGASYNVTPQIRTGTAGKSGMGSTGAAGTNPSPNPSANLNAKNSVTQSQQDLTEVLNAIHQLEENLTSHLSQALVNQVTSHLVAQLTSVIENLLQSTPSFVPAVTASTTSTANVIPADRPQSQPTDPAPSPVISPVTPKSTAQPVVQSTSVQSITVQSTTTPQKSPSQKSAPKQSKPTISAPALAPSSTNTGSTTTASTATESAIIAYFNTQPVTKAFLQSLTVGEKASRKIQAAVPLQIQIRPFANGADLQQRIPEVGPVIWEKIQQNWHTVTIPNQPVNPIVNPIAATPEPHGEDMVTAITETITEILTESIPEPSAPPITVEIPAETITETIPEIIPETIGELVAIPYHLQRLNQLLSTGEGMYQLLIELKHIGFTHKVAQKFIDGIHIYAPFRTFSDLQKIAGLNATNWRYFMHAFPND